MIDNKKASEEMARKLMDSYMGNKDFYRGMRDMKQSTDATSYFVPHTGMSTGGEDTPFYIRYNDHDYRGIGSGRWRR